MLSSDRIPYKLITFHFGPILLEKKHHELTEPGFWYIFEIRMHSFAEGKLDDPANFAKFWK